MRFAACVACSFFLIAALGAPLRQPARAFAAGESLDALLARARLASGSPYRYHVVSRSSEDDGGRTFEVITETEGVKYLAKRCLAGLCTGFYFDGERSFDSNFNDTALPLSARVDGLQATLRAIASYAFTAPDFRRSGGTLSEDDPVERNGKMYRRISVGVPLGAVLDAIVDPQTALVAGVISDERKLAFEFRDQRKVSNAVTLPFTIVLNGSPLEHFNARTIERGALAAPSGLVPQIERGTTTVAFARGAALPIVPCSIGGQNVACLLDTGNSGLAISAQLAARLGLVAQAGLVKAPVLAVGAARYPPAYYVLSNQLHDSYDVVLGADAFAHARISLDYARQNATIANAQTPPAGALGLGFQNYVPAVPVRIGNRGELQLAVDTGDPGTIGLAAGAGGASPGGRAPLVHLGPFDVSGVQVESAALDAAAGDGRIGSGLLGRFNVTFDYAQSAMTLVPRKGDPAITAGGSPASR
jgi:hypothetical protein